jgi:superfamily II DNA helicase RecQ
VSILLSLFDVPNLILTGTATIQIQTDICDVLGLQEERTKVVAALLYMYNAAWFSFCFNRGYITD